MTIHSKVSGTWKEITGAHVNVSSTWKEITEGWEKVSGTWKQFYATLIATLANLSNLSNNGSGTVNAKIKFTNGGNIYESNAAGTYGSSEGIYTDQPTAVWILVDVTAGDALTSNDFVTRTLSSSSTAFGYTDSVPLLGTIRVRLYDAASGGNLLATKSITLQTVVI